MRQRPAAPLLALLLALSTCGDLLAESIFLRAGTPRLQHVSLALPVGDIALPVALDIAYDSKGKLTAGTSATVGSSPVALKGVLKPRGGSWSYKIVARGTADSTKLIVAGVLGRATALAKYKGPHGKAKVDVRVNVIQPPGAVETRLVLIPDVTCDGIISGSGWIESGFGNDGPGVGLLRGKFSRGRLKIVLAQGGRKAVFSGLLANGAFRGTLKLKAPPEKRAIPGFSIDDFVAPILAACEEGYEPDRDYFPLAIGNSWDYDVEVQVGGTIETHTQRDAVTSGSAAGFVMKTTKSNQSGSSFQETWLEQIDGRVVITGGVDRFGGESFPFSNNAPYFLVLPDEPAPGSSTDYDFTTDGGLIVSLALTVLEPETVILDRACFRDALRLRRTVSVRTLAGSSNSITDAWFVGGVGLVKSVNETTSTAGGSSKTTTTTQSLRDFHTE